MIACEAGCLSACVRLVAAGLCLCACPHLAHLVSARGGAIALLGRWSRVK